MLLKTAALVELASLAILLLNLATVHWAPVAALVGPLHGCAYLAVIGFTWQASPVRRTRLLAFVPGIGGVLAARTAR